ncbi:MAG: HU family DNA-binding protein [Ruminococcaceae bacterium]|nr:HU family DNA-binding protein [Oscillospiraceae bacterium]
MTKSELIASVAEKAGLTKKDADKAVNAAIETITEALVSGDKVQIVGFGTFSVKDRKARTAINLMTKEKIEVPATRVASFKVGKALKEAVAK